MKYLSLLILLTFPVLNAEDHAARLIRQPGETMPILANPNLLRNSDFSDKMNHWTMLGDGKAAAVTVGSHPAVSIVNRDNGVILYSDAFDVTPGKNYIMTGVYHTVKAVFGSYSEVALIPDGQEKKFLNDFRQPRIHTPLVRRTMLNCREGQWRRITHQETFTANESRARVIIVLDGNPSQIYWSSFYVGKAGPDTRENPRNVNDRPCSPKEFAERLAKRPDSTAIVKMHGDAPAIFVDGKPIPSHIQFGDAFNASRTRRQSFQKAGVKLQFISLNNVVRQFWRGPNNYDLKAIDDHIRDSIRKNPEGYFVIRLDLTPYPEWYKDYPDTSARHADGTLASSRHGFYGPPDYWSPTYRRAALDYMTAVIRHIREQDYYRAVVGFFPSGNEDQQFYYQTDRKGVLNDGLAPDSLPTFRRFLRMKYADDQALQQAWRKPDITLNTASPEIQNVKYSGAGNFWDREKYQPQIDYTEYLNVMQGEFANLMCRTARKEAGKPVITVMWWGRGAGLSVYPFYSQTSQVLPQGDLDLMGAQSGYYGQRESGSAVYFPWVFDSLRIHGKIPMDEGDYRTWICGFKSLLHDYRVARYWTLEDYTNAVKRQLGKMIGVGGGYWHFAMTDGWYDSPEIMDFIAQTQKIWQELTVKPAVFTPAELVVVADEDDYSLTTEQVNVWNGPNYHTIRNNQDAFLRSGLKYDFYYFSDVMARNMKDYRVYVFSNLFWLSSEKRSFIDSLKRDGKTLIFLYAPGFMNGEKTMRELTGIDIRQCDRESKLARFEKSNSPLLKGISGQRAGLGVDMPGERFEVTDSKALPIARYADGKIAGALRTFRDWNSIYLATPSCFTPEFLQNIARLAGVHIYNTPGDMFFHHRDDLLALHGVEGNANQLRFPYPVELQDLYTGEILRDPTVKLKPGESRLFRVKRR